ncbi:MAG TPA: hypothetical protein VEU96_02220 [Bryobacteraceae bacterium]|nr:hypothetical protein [Bryobacteraceae bacterium]
MITTEASGFRSKEQVLIDLAQAFPFSPEALEANRQGKLAKEQFKKYIGRCSRPATMAVVCFLAPLVFWTAITAGKLQVSFDEAFPVFLSNLVHVSQLAASQGKWGAFVTLTTTIVFLGLAFFMASRISIPLYFDLLDRKVTTQEARLIAHEDQVLRENGRDPIEKYYFGVKGRYYEVNLGSYRALESGSVYLLYLLPRSDLLVSLEPKISR